MKISRLLESKSAKIISKFYQINIQETDPYEVLDILWRSVLELAYYQIHFTGPPSIENGVLGTEKLLLKAQVSKDFAQRSESNNILQCKIKMDKITAYYNGCYRNRCQCENFCFFNITEYKLVQFEQKLFMLRVLTNLQS